MDFLDMKNVLIIGLGSAGKKHVDALNKLEKEAVTIYALRNNPESADNYKQVKNIKSLDDLPSIPDFAIISNPTSLHAVEIAKLLKYEIPLLIEKPVVSSLKDGIRIQKEIKAKNISTHVGCNLRFLKAMQFTKDFLHKEALTINEVNIYGGSDLSQWRPHQDFRKSYSANEALGGGIHMDWIHELDYLYWLFGAPSESIKVFGRKSSLAINSIDYANYTFTYPDFYASVILNYYRKDRKRTMEVVTSTGTLLLEVELGNVYFDNKKIFAHSENIVDTYTHQMEYFLNILKKNTQSMNDFNHALTVLKMCLPNEKA